MTRFVTFEQFSTVTQNREAAVLVMEQAAMRKDSEGDPAALRYQNEVAGERPEAVSMLLIRESWRLMTIRGTRRNRAKMLCFILLRLMTMAKIDAAKQTCA